MSNTCALRSLPACFRRSKNPQKASTRFQEDPLFLHTDDFWRDYHEMNALGVKFCEAPRDESYGTVAVFEDLYDNRWDLLQLRR